MIVSVACSAPHEPPLTGASSIAMPRSASRPARARVSSGEIVLMSISTEPSAIASAFAAVRLKATTLKPALARLRGIGAPMMPVPTTPIVSRSDISGPPCTFVRRRECLRRALRGLARWERLASVPI